MATTRPKPPRSRAVTPRQVLSHLSEAGDARMVDVGGKPRSSRRAVAEATVRMAPATARQIVDRRVPKGDVLAAARLAGIMAAKRTAELIPLCHPLALTRVDVTIVMRPRSGVARIRALVEAEDRTGVEMEALVAASVASLTIYDMAKAIDRAMVIAQIVLLEKEGGRSGHYRRSPQRS